MMDDKQVYFWTKEWQEAEKEASEDIKQGRLSPVFSSAKKGIKYLRDKAKKLKINTKMGGTLCQLESIERNQS